MKPIAWLEDLRLGIPKIDEDHKNLFKYMIRLEEINQQLASGHVDCNSEIAWLLEQLHQYSIEHFEEEERLMDISGYPDAKLHIMIHDWFKDRMEKEYEVFKVEGSKALPRLLRFVRIWWEEHIKNIDKNYSDHLKKFLEAYEYTHPQDSTYSDPPSESA